MELTYPGFIGRLLQDVAQRAHFGARGEKAADGIADVVATYVSPSLKMWVSKEKSRIRGLACLSLPV